MSESGAAAAADPVIREIAFGSDLYDQTACFRDCHLRRPLGMVLAAADVAGEDHQIHIAAVQGGHVVATVVLKPLSPARVKLRQMAVDPARRGTGLGRSLIRFAERLARERGFDTIEMSARTSATGFYEKLGYHAVGAGFREVGLPHITLTRSLRT